MLKVISVFLYSLRLALCHTMWLILKKVSWDAEEKVCSLMLEWNVLQMSLGPFNL